MKTFLQKNALNLFAMAFSTFALVTTIAVNGPQGPVGSSGAVGPVGSSGPIGSTGATGATGATGSQGEPGADGSTPYIGINGNWWIDGIDSGISASGTIVNTMGLPSYRVVPTQEEQGYLTEDATVFDLTNQAAYVNEKLTQGYVAINSVSAFQTLIEETGQYVLTSDLDFSTVESWETKMVGSTGAFKGTLDGAGYTIRNLDSDQMTTPNNSQNGMGLFFALDGATVINLNFHSAYLDLKAKSINGIEFTSVGLLAGMIDASTIQNITISDSFVSGVYAVGLLAGSMYQSRIDNVVLSNGNVSGTAQIGGLVGQAYFSVLFYISVDIMMIEGSFALGGLIGNSEHNLIFYIELFLAFDNGFKIDSIYEFGGISGNSYYDRYFYVSANGEMVFNTNLNEQNFSSIGGISGFADNSTYFVVENYIDMHFYLDGILYTETAYISSVGGIVGNVMFALIDHALNFGDLIIHEPLSGFNLDIYGNTPDEFPIEYLGGVVGYVTGSAFISHVVNFAEIKGFAEVGGILGSTGIPFFFFQQNVILQSAVNFGYISGFAFVGGMVGLMDQRTYFTVANVINYGQIEGIYGIGGLVGLLSPMIGIKINVINSANFGTISVFGSGGGGLLGGASPFFNFMFDFPVFGEINVYNSFNVGNINIPNLEDFFWYITIGSVIGVRDLMITMYGVSYLKQTLTIDIPIYNPDTDTYEPSGELIDVVLPPVGMGNAIDLSMVENADLLTTPENFIYRSVWNMQTTWAWYDGLLMPQMPSFIN